MKLYYLYENLLKEIEKTLDDRPTIEKIANNLSVSSSHLCRLFKSAFNVSLASYIRSRKLSASINLLYNTNLHIIDIAQQYGFEHAQSYIRAFSNEFGLTPGQLRKSHEVVNITPPIHLFNAKNLTSGILFNPDIVFIPEIKCIGKEHKSLFDTNPEVPAKAGRDFWIYEKHKIHNILNKSIYFGLTKIIPNETKYNLYIPSVSVTSFDFVPKGFKPNTIPSCQCIRFCYIGEHHYLDINKNIAGAMYDSIERFTSDNEAKYGLFKYNIFFEKINVKDYDGRYCKMEWFSPIYEK